MPYWGSGSIDSDYAFGAIGVYVLMIKERMFEDADNVIAKSFPEQSIVASLGCLRAISLQFPKSLKVHFRRSDLEKAKEKFYQWYDCVERKLPQEYREAIKSNAETEFQLFESEVFLPK